MRTLLDETHKLQWLVGRQVEDYREANATAGAFLEVARDVTLYISNAGLQGILGTIAVSGATDLYRRVKRHRTEGTAPAAADITAWARTAINRVHVDVLPANGKPDLQTVDHARRRWIVSWRHGGADYIAQADFAEGPDCSVTKQLLQP